MFTVGPDGKLIIVHLPFITQFIKFYANKDLGRPSMGDICIQNKNIVVCIQNKNVVVWHSYMKEMFLFACLVMYLHVLAQSVNFPILKHVCVLPSYSCFFKLHVSRNRIGKHLITFW